MNSVAITDPVQEVLARMDKVGDLPIFSASVNRVQVISSDPNADAMALALEVLKDASLSAKVLKLINSPFYNRGHGKISSLSRAIVLLGFDTIRNTTLTMKLIESFTQGEDAQDMGAILVNSYLSAGFVSGLAMECGARDVELSYVSGLLHNFGEIIVAHTMPEHYARATAQMTDGNVPWEEAQRRIFSTTLRKIGQEIIEKWDFPATVVQSMAAPGASSGGMVRDKVELNRVLASYATRMMDTLYARKRVDNKSFAQLTAELAKATGLGKEAVSKCLSNSFKKSCDLAEAYGLNKKHLMPKVTGSGDDDRDRIAREFAFYASNHGKPAALADATADAGAGAGGNKPASASTPDAAADAAKSERGATASAGDPTVLLDVLSDITQMITDKQPPNRVFSAVLEGMQRGIGFDNAVLCLLTPDHKQYVARAALGPRAEQIKRYFNLPVNPKGDAFSKLMMGGSELHVDDIEDGWKDMLPGNFAAEVGAKSFVIAALRVRDRPVGMFYADKSLNGKRISAQEHRTFLQLVAQAKLALQVR